MNNQIKNLVMVSVVLTPMSVGAMKINDDKFEIYSKIHMSVDFSDRDDSAVTNDGMSISSNSSRLGFKGKASTKSDFDIIWKMEQEISFDDSSKGNFANRNSYIGLVNNNHSVLLGVHDTPFKSIASKWGVFGDSVAERRSILGASHNRGNQLNERVKNMLMYQFKNKAIKLQAMYAVDGEGAAPGAVDDNDTKVTGIGVWYKVNKLKLSAGLENWKNHGTIEDGSAYRLAAAYKLNAHQLGFIYENIDSDGATANALAFKRAAYGVNWKWKFSAKSDVRVQYLIADDAEGASDTGASKLGLGVYHKLDKVAKVYVVYGATDNDANAKFQAVDGGHGDEVKTATGGNPTSLSAGIEYKF